MSSRLAVLATALTVLLAARPAAAQEQGFRGEERVTAIDLVVEVAGAGGLRSEEEVPRGLQADELTVTMGGEVRSVVAVETAVEPWRTVLYFDLALLSKQGVVWAVDALVPTVPRLVELGSVEVMVADPEPRSLLGPSGDADVVTGVLAQLAHGTDVEVSNVQIAVRNEVLDALDAGRVAGFPAAAGAPVSDEDTAEEESAEPVDPAELVRFAVADEVARLGAQLDHLLLEMAGSRAGLRRALFYVGAGYDLQPEAFYAEHLPDVALDAATGEAVDELAARVESAARALAAYGWVTFAVAPPEPDDGLLPGFRIGKWRLRPARSGDAERWNETMAENPNEAARRTDPVTESAVGQPTVAPIIVAKRESDRDPDKARAHFEVARALLGQGKLEEAEEAAEKALHHFYRDPRTADEQAAVYELLGTIRERRGDVDAARRAYELAAERDPERPLPDALRRGRLVAPRPALATLAAETAGGVVDEPAELASAVAGLGRRLRVTYQVPGPPSGRLQPVELAIDRGGYIVRYPLWARTATPDAVAAARLRRLLGGDLLTGSFDVEARYRPSASDRDRGELRVVVPGTATAESAGALPETLLRVSLAQGGPDVEPVLRHDLFAPRVRGDDWRYTSPVQLAPARPWLAVVVEDLDTGQWGGALVERMD